MTSSKQQRSPVKEMSSKKLAKYQKSVSKVNQKAIDFDIKNVQGVKNFSEHFPVTITRNILRTSHSNEHGLLKREI